jgi:acetyl/propionyl-CoA carboxylase alpha subunit
MQKQSFTVTTGDQKHKIEAENFQLDKPGAYSGTINGESFSCDVISTGGNRLHVLRDNKSYEVEILDVNHEEKTMIVKVNGNKYPLHIADKYDELLHSLGMDKAMVAKVNELKAPMPGLVLDIIVSEGQAVKKGEAIVVLEAMKMENILKAPVDVTIKKISVKKGTAVEKGQVLIQFG